MVAIKAQVIRTLGLLPPDALVGLMTYGTMVGVHELGFSECAKSYVLRGNKDYTAQQVQDLLGLTRRPAGQPGQAPQQQQQQQQQPGGARANRFLMPLSECELSFTAIVEDLQRDPWPVKAECRPQRCAGTAMSVAVSLMESVCGGQAGRIMLFIGGPVTVGPGMIVAEELKEQIRSWYDFGKDNVPHHKKAVKHYEALAKRCVAASHVVDLLCCCIDQVGLYEMRSLAEKTGGTMLMCEDFAGAIFKQSFARMFERDASGTLKMGFNAVCEVQTSREARVIGALGPCCSLGKKGPSVGETEIGEAGTCAWKLCGLDPETSMAFYFEVVNQANNNLGPGAQRYVQFTTQYIHPSGETRQRVTTVAHHWVDGSDASVLAAGFDQEAAVALMARWSIYKAESEEKSFDILRFLDRTLIKLCARFASYRKDDPSSFHLGPNFSFFPQFLFHLRRSNFLQTFNASPDESCYYRLIFNRNNVTNSVVMIQPTLLAYSFDGPPRPVLLDTTAVAPDRILLLDSYFHVLIFHGDTIAQWRHAGYQNQPGYENFKGLLEAPMLDAEEIVKSRRPTPRLIVTDQGGSQARFLLARLNPSKTHNANAADGGVMLLSDDVSLQVFTEHLKRLAVSDSAK
jgi:protein transport protein SEC23